MLTEDALKGKDRISAYVIGVPCVNSFEIKTAKCDPIQKMNVFQKNKPTVAILSLGKGTDRLIRDAVFFGFKLQQVSKE
jgi:hypothetical protein